MEPLIMQQSAQQLGPASLRMDRSYAYSVSGGAGGRGTKISSVTYGSRFGSGMGGSFESYQSLGSLGSAGSVVSQVSIGNEKSTMQHLNDRLATYLEKVRSLEKANGKLEIKIRETLEKRGPMEEKDYAKYNTTIVDLRAKILDMIKGNAQIAIAMDNARLASEDFRTKMEYEMGMRQTVEGDVAKLRKVLDETNVIRLHLETDIESLKEEIILLKKHHKEDMDELRLQITQVGVHVDVDARKGQDLAKIMEEMRAKYEAIARKNEAELKVWHESQITEVQTQVTEGSAALKESHTIVTETRKRYQGLEIELQSQLSLKSSLEATLRDIEQRYNWEMEKYNVTLLRLQEELTSIRADIQQQKHEYGLLLNIKVKLEAEIAEYRRLLDGEADFKLEDAVDSKKTIQTKVVTVTQTLVDGKVVSESKDIKASQKEVDA